MSALEELREGRVGESFLGLLQRTIRAVAIARGFPPPDGHLSWGSGALETAVSDFLASAQTPRRLADLRLHCRTDFALAGRLERTVRNFLADTGRRTPVGRLVLRFNEVLGKDADFQRDGKMWALTGSQTEPAEVNFERLAAAVAATDVVVPTAWTSGSRQSPDIDGPSVTRLARVMLETAGGSLRPGVMASVAAHRLGLGGASLSIDATAFDPAQPSPISNDTTGDEVMIAVRAREVLDLLNDQERLAIGLPSVSLDDLGVMIGVSRSKAHLIRKRAVTILQNELREEDGGQAIADSVLNLARTWSESWTI